ncbi:hypothetical protein GQ53DRAFT_768476 [Thozetella sp. PMI_491]|nr:hypothetical protein GQ53DRAFT_768476 [Thozetella sp. PMI_491]
MPSIGDIFKLILPDEMSDDPSGGTNDFSIPLNTLLKEVELDELRQHNPGFEWLEEKKFVYDTIVGSVLRRLYMDSRLKRKTLNAIRDAWAANQRRAARGEEVLAVLPWAGDKARNRANLVNFVMTIDGRALFQRTRHQDVAVADFLTIAQQWIETIGGVYTWDEADDGAGLVDDGTGNGAGGYERVQANVKVGILDPLAALMGKRMSSTMVAKTIPDASVKEMETTLAGDHGLIKHLNSRSDPVHLKRHVEADYPVDPRHAAIDYRKGRAAFFQAKLTCPPLGRGRLAKGS